MLSYKWKFTHIIGYAWIYVYENTGFAFIHEQKYAYSSFCQNIIHVYENTGFAFIHAQKYT